MKRLFLLLITSALVLCFVGCSNIPAGTSVPPQTTSSTSTIIPSTSITIGNFKFDRDSCVSAEAVGDHAFLITLEETGVYATLYASDISTLNEKEASVFLKALHESEVDADSYRSEGTITAISFAGFDLTHEYYMTIDDGNRITYHIDCTFTDSWYAYSFCLIAPSSVKDLGNAGYLYGQFLSTGSYIGKTSRFDLVQADTSVGDPNTTEPSVTQPATTPSTTPPPTTIPTVTNPPATQPITTEPQISVGMKNALKTANGYLKFMPFSYGGLIDQLEYEGYTNAEATYAADNCGADWNTQALKSAESYLDFSAFSYSGLIDQLEYEQFTAAQAIYAADNCGADWNEQAAKCAATYLDIMAFSRSGLIEQLEFDGFTHEQAVYGVEANGL